MYERSSDELIDISALRDLLRRLPALRLLPGKSGSGGQWLPTWLHLADTAGVMDHLLSRWITGSVIAATRTSDDDFRRVCLFLALTHDIGKLTPLFAARITQSLPDIKEALVACGISSVDISGFHGLPRSPHALAGGAVLHKFGCPRSVVSVVGAHHGHPQTKRRVSEELENGSDKAQNYYGYSAEKGNYIDSPEGQLWEAVRLGWLDFALAEVGADSPDALPELNMQAQLLASGLLIMADWIASNTTYFPPIHVDDRGCDIDTASRVDRAMSEIELPDLWSPCRFAVSCDDFEDEFGFAPNEMQRALLDAATDSTEGGIFILEAPMGCGKTEAALAAAEVLASKNGNGGIFFGLPTQATANGIFGRIKSWAEHQSEATVQAIRLAHGMAELNEDYRALFQGRAVTDEDREGSGLTAHSWFKGRKQALLADFVIGTVDQLLLAALKQRHFMLRHLGLAGKVVIIDECHAYDAYMNQYLDTAVMWLGAYHVPVIILSATLPARRRAELIKSYLKKYGDTSKKIPTGEPWSTCRAYPLLTWTDGMDVRQETIPFSQKSGRVAIERITDDVLGERVRVAVDAGGCTGVIVNTVARAQEVAQTLREAIPDAEVRLFHSRFTTHDRAERERELLLRIGKGSTEQSRRGLVVVGTQVLEQSLDIDFDFLVSDLCPMDLLLQRLGRLHRHTRHRPDALREARCAVLGATGDELERGGRAVYRDWPLLMTRHLLPDAVVLPDDIADLVQDAYDDSGSTGPEITGARADYDMMVQKKQSEAETYRLREPSLRRKQVIDGMLDTDITDDEPAGAAAVRDGIKRISALVMARRADGSVSFVPWAHDGERVDAHSTPPSIVARKIASQRIDMPYVFGGKLYNDTVMELERVTKTLPEWQTSPLLDGELVLLLDGRGEAALCGYLLKYDREQGLIYNRIEEGCDDDE